MKYKHGINQNKILWEQWSALHFDSAFYDLPAFLRGHNTLNEIERNEIGDISGKTVLHLQCHFGLDSLSLARMGATVTGVDISEVAIKKARELNRLLKLDARFYAADIYESGPLIRKEFDMVFTSYGAIEWLPDLVAWASLIAAYLKRGGIFYMVEFHPVLWMLDERTLAVKYPYDSQGKPLVFTDMPSYAVPDIQLRNREYNWQHGLGSIFNALTGAGLSVRFLNEHFYSPYPVLPDMMETEPSRWKHQSLPENFPYVFSLSAIK